MSYPPRRHFRCLQNSDSLLRPNRNARIIRGMTVELSQSQEALIQEQLATGRYHSRAEVIADALHLLNDHTRLERMKLERLRAEIQTGIDSGPPTPFDMEEVKAEVRRRHNERHAQ